MNVILESLIKNQTTGIVWTLTFPSGRVYNVQLVFPLALCIVDIKGAHSLCGMFDAYSNISRPCVSCKCIENDLDDPYASCINVTDIEMKKKIFSSTEDELKKFSQHKLVDNAFFRVNIGGWKFGIWGLCPAEILHQYYEGLIAYTLEFFFQSILTERSRNNLNRSVQQIIESCKCQSDRNFPSATFTTGISYSSKMKGTEKFAAIFYLALYLYTKASKNLFNGCHGSHISESSLKKWRQLFERILFYHDWLMQKQFSRKDIKEKQVLVVELFSMFKQLVKRTDGSQLKIPKLHELLHSCRDILRHGPARGYDTCPTESNHKPLKSLSQNTQRIKSKFEEQTAKRLFESNVIETAWKDSKSSCLSTKYANVTNTSFSKSNNVKKSHCYGAFQLVRIVNDLLKKSRKNKQKNFCFKFKETNFDKTFEPNEKISQELLTYMSDEIFEYLDESTNSLNCFTIYKNDKNIYYGLPVRKRIQITNPSWAQFEWDESENCPGKCLMFVDLSNVRYKENAPVTYEPDIHVIIQSLSSSIVSDANNIKIAHRSSLFKVHPYYCVSVHTISKPAFVIPDIGNDNNEQYLYVFPRQIWKDSL